MPDVKKLFFTFLGLVLILTLTACSSPQTEFALQSASLVLGHIEANPLQVNPGATVVLDIDFASTSEHLPEGRVIVTDSQGNAYQEEISNLKDARNTSVTSTFRLSPLAPAGELLLQVFVLDTQGNSSNTGFVTITVL